MLPKSESADDVGALAEAISRVEGARGIERGTVGIVPLMVLERWYGVPRQLTVGYGFLSYISGVALLKMPIYHALVVRHLHGRLSHAPLAASQGFVSALSEMGAAAAFFDWVVPSLTFWQVVGFGYAAGAVEAIVLPVYSVLYNLNLFQPGLLLVILLGSVGYVAVGTLLSSMAVQTRTRDVLLPILLFPVAVPILIAAVKASGGYLVGAPMTDILLS